MKTRKIGFSAAALFIAFFTTVHVFGGLLPASHFPFLAPILEDNDLKMETGLWKLTDDQLASLDYHLGQYIPYPGFSALHRGPSHAPSIIAHFTNPRKYEDGVLQLDNLMVLNIPAPENFTPGPFDEVLLFRMADQWLVWMEDLGLMDTQINGFHHSGHDQVRALPLTLDVIADDGDFLVTSEGIVLEVSVFDENQVEEWLPGERTMLLDDEILINLDRLEEAVAVERLR